MKGQPRWHGSEYAKAANAEDSGKPGRQPVNEDSERHEHGLEEFAKNALRVTFKWTDGSRAAKRKAALIAGEKAHNAAEKTIKP
jgi:hypothetical protein